MTNIITTLTGLTTDDIAAAYTRHSDRIKHAANDVCERYLRRHMDGVNCPDELPVVPQPHAPALPDSVRQVTSPDTYGLRYVTPEAVVGDICMHSLTRIYYGRHYYDLVPATPAAYLAGLRGIGDLADSYEALARQYRADTEAAIAAHAASQLDAVRALTALVAVQLGQPVTK